MREYINGAGFVLAAVGWLVLIIQLAGVWRFDVIDPFWIQVTTPGSAEQVALLGYLVITIICLTCKE